MQVIACTDELKKAKQLTFKFNQMKQEKTITADEMQEIVQDVIDRLLYLDADELAMFKTFLNKTNEVFPINMTKKDGLRIYGLINKN